MTDGDRDALSALESELTLSSRRGRPNLSAQHNAHIQAAFSGRAPQPGSRATGVLGVGVVHRELVWEPVLSPESVTTRAPSALPGASPGVRLTQNLKGHTQLQHVLFKKSQTGTKRAEIILEVIAPTLPVWLSG